MEFCLFLRYVMFVVRFLGRLSSWARCFSVVRARRVRVVAFFLKNWHLSSHLRLKSASSLQRRLSLRN